MANKIHTDVAIIGGGIVGSAIAYYVSKAGIEATLIEKKDIASGTSSRCDGNITIVDKDPGFDSEMSLKSQELTVDLTKELDLPFEYRKHGSILVCDNDDEMQAAVDWVKRSEEHTSELQSRGHLVCRLLLEKKKKNKSGNGYSD